MIDRVEIKNFKALWDAILPLGPFTLIVGANGSGKSTALNAIDIAVKVICNQSYSLDPDNICSISITHPPSISTKVSLFGSPDWEAHAVLSGPYASDFSPLRIGGRVVGQEEFSAAGIFPMSARQFAFNPKAIAEPATLQPTAELAPDGGNLAAVLDRLRDNHPERFEAINASISQWLPDHDRILFDTPTPGNRAIKLRARGTNSGVRAVNLSEGTLVILALLTLAYLPDPPTIVMIEEPDRGIHPRLFRLLQDALYRLSHPEGHDEKRSAVQVLVTTHSPYFLDLFKDHPEEIVIAEKYGTEAKFTSLSERKDIREILDGASLGEAWFTGALGGVPAGT